METSLGRIANNQVARGGQRKCHRGKAAERNLPWQKILEELGRLGVKCAFDQIAAVHLRVNPIFQVNPLASSPPILHGFESHRPRVESTQTLGIASVLVLRGRRGVHSQPKPTNCWVMNHVVANLK